MRQATEQQQKSCHRLYHLSVVISPALPATCVGQQVFFSKSQLPPGTELVPLGAEEEEEEEEEAAKIAAYGEAKKAQAQADQGLAPSPAPGATATIPPPSYSLVSPPSSSLVSPRAGAGTGGDAEIEGQPLLDHASRPPAAAATTPMSSRKMQLRLAAENIHKSLQKRAGEVPLFHLLFDREQEQEQEREEERVRERVREKEREKERVQQEEQGQDEGDEEDEEEDEEDEEESGQARHGASTSRAPQKQSVSCADSQVTSTTTSKARKKRKKKGPSARLRKDDDCTTKCAALYSTKFNVGTCDLSRMMFRGISNKAAVKKDVIAVPLSTLPSEHKGAADKTCAFFNLVASSVAVMDLTVTRANKASCLTVHPPSLPADGGPCTAVLQLDMEDVCIECVDPESRQPKSKQVKTMSSLCEIYSLERKGGIVTDQDMALKALCHVAVDPDTNPPAQKKQRKQKP